MLSQQNDVVRVLLQRLVLSEFQNIASATNSFRSAWVPACAGTTFVGVAELSFLRWPIYGPYCETTTFSTKYSVSPKHSVGSPLCCA
jgi:hypothetical protein